MKPCLFALMLTHPSLSCAPPHQLKTVPAGGGNVAVPDLSFFDAFAPTPAKSQQVTVRNLTPQFACVIFRIFGWDGSLGWYLHCEGTSVWSPPVLSSLCPPHRLEITWLLAFPEENPLRTHERGSSRRWAGPTTPSRQRVNLSIVARIVWASDAGMQFLFGDAVYRLCCLQGVLTSSF